MSQKATERSLNAAHAAALEEYRSKEATAPSSVVRDLSDKVKTARKALSSYLSEGATSCPECQGEIIGLRKNPAIIEVGCNGCPLRAQAATREDAVEDWNNQNYTALKEVEKPKIKNKSLRAKLKLDEPPTA